MTVNDIITTASAEIGNTEYPPGSNNVKYNTDFYGRPVHDGDRPNATYPWCCAFVWWVFRKFDKNFPKTASCINLGDYFKKKGRFFTDESLALPGDIVFMKFNTNSRWTNHVGILERVASDGKHTIEGNTSINSNDNGGAVMRRVRNSNIVGYGRPVYDKENKPETVTTTNKPTLKRGDKNEYVRAWQNYLISCGISCGKWGADADFGSNTEKAVKEYQRQKGLPITGIIDADDWNSVGK